MKMKNLIFLLLIAVCSWVLLTQAKGVYSSEDHQRLRRNLFTTGKYDRSVRPVRNASKATLVEMQFFVAQVLDVDERLETFKINAWLTMRWFDEYLTWDPDDYNGLTNFKISKDIVWMPDLWLYNNAGSRYEDYTANSICSVYSNGRVVWQSPTIITTHCSMDVTNFPFDYQECPLTFGPWQHGADEITLNGTGSAEKYLRSSGEWEVIGFETVSGREDYVIYEDDTPVPYTFVEYSVKLHRIPTYFVFYLIMPCFLISGTTFLSFFLPPESGEKVSLGITVLLSLTVFLLIVAELLPPTDVVPIIGIYYAATMVMVSLSLAMSVVVLNLHHRGPETHQVPPWLRRIVHGRVGRLFMMRRTTKKREYETYRKRRWKALSSIEMEPLDTAVNGWEDRLDNSMPSANELDTRKQLNALRSASSTRLREISLLESIREEFRLMRELALEKEKVERCENDWKQVALVVDRIFMVIFFLGMLSTMFFIVLQFNFN
ncbi:neuronal acetylcholine receptor subunit beta-3-like isoform X1 [Apostichopus japonicus]|uniref:neuronal acetylcholine receptor subunit beta-3-like isoform X1 n=1 Tax=Stichopus japonicus TaxID=307972 RepID=UPI003AB659EB